MHTLYCPIYRSYIHTRVSWGPILSSASCADKRKIPFAVIWHNLPSLMNTVAYFLPSLSFWFSSAHFHLFSWFSVWSLCISLKAFCLRSCICRGLVTFDFVCVRVCAFSCCAAKWISLLALKPPHSTSLLLLQCHPGLLWVLDVHLALLALIKTHRRLLWGLSIATSTKIIQAMLQICHKCCCCHAHFCIFEAFLSGRQHDLFFSPGVLDWK